MRHVQDVQRRGVGDAGGGKPAHLHVDKGTRGGIGGDGDRYLEQRDVHRTKFRGGRGADVRVGEMLEGSVMQRSPSRDPFTRQCGGNGEQITTQMQQLEGAGLAHHSNRGRTNPFGHGFLSG